MIPSNFSTAVFIRFPEATFEELEEADQCIICRDLLHLGSRKLPCNHIFHMDCLKAWFIQQQTCPTCRSDMFVAAASQSQPPPPVTLMTTEEEEIPEVTTAARQTTSATASAAGRILPTGGRLVVGGRGGCTNRRSNRCLRFHWHYKNNLNFFPSFFSIRNSNSGINIIIYRAAASGGRG